MTDADWPFAEVPDLAAITLHRILDGEADVLAAFRDEDGWQFLDGQPVEVEHAALVALKTMLELEPSIRELADLEVGQRAYRESRDAPWQRG